MKKIMKKYEEIISYIVVGGLTTIVSVVTFFGSTLTFLDGNDAIQLQIANGLSWFLAVLFSYYMNRRCVFRSENDNIKKEFISFVSSRILTLLMDIMVMFLGATWLKMNYKAVKIASMVLITVANYVLGKFLVFNKK